MKLCRIGPPAEERPACIIEPGVVVDLGAQVRDFDRGFFAEGGLDQLSALADGSPRRVLRDDERVGPPIATPSKIVCIGLNYADHAAEAGLPVPDEPAVFTKSPSSLSGPNDPITKPAGSTKLDWEVELGIVVGRQIRAGSDVSNPLAQVAGYVLSQDVSERSYQHQRGGQWMKGKSYDTFNPLGPWLMTSDEVEDPGELRLRLSVNDALMQDGTTAEMIFDVEYILAYLAQFMTLEPGDLINTGTPAGVGAGRQPARFLDVGDRVVATIEPGFGEQHCEIVAS